ncbi:MAG: SPOR domain-containing protein [Xylophilus ampelinus]
MSPQTMTPPAARPVRRGAAGLSRAAQRAGQAGGTVLGLILGVVLGLGVALAVAVYVTKVPVPFLSKGATRSTSQDEDDAKRNRDWDPNSALASKRAAARNAAAPGAAQGVTPPAAVPAVPAPEAPPAAAPAGGRSPAAPPARPAAPRASDDPLGDLARARSERAPSATVAAARPEAPAPAADADGYSYFVQAGAYRTTADAESQRARLAIMGWEARVTEREQAGRTVYRVRVGPFAKRDDADRLKDRLDTAGVESTLVRVQR